MLQELRRRNVYGVYGVNHMNSRILVALRPVIAQQIRTHAGFQKIPEKEIATCAQASTEEEVKAGQDTSELRFKFF